MLCSIIVFLTTIVKARAFGSGTCRGLAPTYSASTANASGVFLSLDD
jgi:hypothetical protein